MKRLDIYNQTNHALFLSDSASSTSNIRTTVLPGASTTLSLLHLSAPLSIHGHIPAAKSHSELKPTASPDSFTVRASLSLGASWQAINVNDNCSWLIYRSRKSRRHHCLLILPRRNLSAFLRDIPDSVPLSALTLPGTHDSVALYGWPISQCQSLATPLQVQLHAGVRVLDVRLAVKESGLMAYHSVVPQHISFQAILSIIHHFLTALETSHETIVMSIKQEDFATVDPKVFSKYVHDEIDGGPGGKGMWFLENRIPLLGEVRGKVIMFSRFGGDGTGWDNGLEGLGIHPTTWPDSEKYGFKWNCKNTLVRTHDWYNIPSFLAIPEKVSLATNVLLLPPDIPPFPNLAITFFSASSFPFAFPPTIARGFGWPSVGLGVEGVNARVGKWLIDQLSGDPGDQSEKYSHHRSGRIRGWTFMDFYTDPQGNSVVPLLVECNFRGRISGEEGWP